MSLRSAAPLAALLLFACAGGPQPAPQPAISPAAGPAPGAPPPSGPQTAQASQTPPKKPEPTQAEKIAAAKSALEAAKPPFEEAVAAAADKKVTSEGIDRVREASKKLETALADGQGLESKDADYGKLAAELRAALEKAKTELDARWLEIGVGLQRSGLDQAIKNANKELGAAKQKTATEEAVSKAEAAVAALAPLVERGSSLEPKDKKYADWVAGLKPQIEALGKSAVEARKAFLVRTQQDTLTKAKTAADAAVAKLKTSVEEPTFEAVKTALAELDKALSAGKALEDSDPAYQKLAAAVRAGVEKANIEVTAQRARQKIELHKAAVEVARKASAEALPKPTEPASFEASEKALAELEKVLETGKDFLATDKGSGPVIGGVNPPAGAIASLNAYAAYAATITKEIAARRAAILALRQQLAVNADGAKVDAAATELDVRLGALKAKPDPAQIIAAEKAVADFEVLQKAGEALAAKDKGFAARLATASKKLPELKAAIARTKNEAAITAHKAEVSAAQAKLSETLKGLEGKLEYELYEAGERAVDALKKVLTAGAPLGAENPKYAAELKAIEAGLPAHRMQMRRTWIEAATAQVKERLKALEGKPAKNAFEDAEKAVKVLANTVTSGKGLTPSDAAYQAYIAAAEKQLPLYSAQIDGRRLGVLVEAHRARVDQAAAVVAERMKLLEGEPPTGAFESATASLAELEQNLSPDYDLTKSDKANQALLADLKKKIEAHRATIARRKIEVVVAGHKKKVTDATAAVAERLKALETATNPTSIKAAQDAVSSLEDVLNGGSSAAEADAKYAAELAAGKKKLEPYRAEIEKRRVDAANLAARTKVEAAAAALKAATGPESLDRAAAELEAAVGEGEALAVKDKVLVGLIAGEKKRVADTRQLVSKQRLALEVSEHAAKLTAAEATVNERLAAVTGKTEQGLYVAAEAAIGELKKLAQDGASIGERDPPHAKRLAAVNGQISGYRVTMQRRRIEASNAVVLEKLKGLEGKPAEAAFDAAESALKDLSRTIESSKNTAPDDKSFAQTLATSEKTAAGHKALIDRRRIEVLVDAHKTTLDAAEKAVTERMEVLKGKPDAAAFKDAETAVSGLSATLEKGAAAAAKDPNYGKRITALQGKIDGFKKAIEKRRGELELLAHVAKLDAANAASAEKQKTLTEAGLVDAAEAAASALEQEIAAGAGFAKTDANHAKKLSALSAEAVKRRAAIANARVELAVAEHKKSVESAAADATKRVEELASGATPEGLKLADKAVGALEAAIKAGEELGKKSVAYGKVLTTYPKRVSDLRAMIARRTLEKDVKAQRERLLASEADVKKALEALPGKLEYTLYEAAENAISSFKKVIDGGAELGAKDPSLAKEQAAATARIGEHGITVRKTWIEAAQAAVATRIQALDAKATEKLFKEAETAVTVLDKTIDSGKTLTPAAPYQKYLDTARAQAAAQRKTIEKRRVEVVVDAHRAQLDPAEKAVAEKMEALKGKPAPEAFKAAESAVNDLKSALGTGGEAANKDPNYGKRLAALEKKVEEHKATIERRRFETDLAAHKEKVAGATKNVTAGLAALAKGSEPALFSAADEAISTLELALGAGKSLGEKNPAYAKELAAAEKQVPDYRARTAKRRVEVDLAAHAARLSEAEAAVKTKSADPSALEATEQAIGALESEIEAGQGFAKNDAKHAARLAALSKDFIPKKRAAIAAARLEAETQQHKKTVESAVAEADKRIEALAQGPTASTIKAAEDSVSGLEETLKNGAELAKRSDKHAKWLAGLGKKISDLRGTIARRTVETQVKAHRAKLEGATAEVTQTLAALSGKLEYELYAGAEDKIASLGKVIDGGAELAEKDKTYAKELATAKAGLDGFRIAARRTWIDAAEAQVAARLKALESKPGEPAFRDAEEAVKVLTKTIDSGKNVSAAPAFQKALAAAEKNAAAYRATIDKRRVALVVDAHKAELEGALSSVTAGLDALKEKTDPGVFKAAEKAVSDLRSTIDSGADAGTKDPAYAKRLAGLKPKLEEYTKTINQRRSDAEVGASRAKLKAATDLVAQRLGALSGKPDAAAFAAAQEAVGDLGVALAEARPVADKNKGYDKELNAEKAKIDGYQARIAKRKLELEMAEHLASLTAAEAAVKEGVKDGGYDAAEAAVSALEKEIGAGAQFAKSDAKHAARLAALKKDLPVRRAKIAALRLDAEVGQHKKAVEAAAAEAGQRIEGLAQGPTPSAIKAAEDAVGGLEQAVKSGSELGQKSPAHAKWLGTYGKRVADLRGTIGRRAVETQVKAYRAKVEESQQEVAKALEGLSGKLEYELYAGAEGQIAALGKVIDGGADLAEQDKAYAKELAAQKAKLDGYRITARKTWIDAADAAVTARMKALEGKVSEQAFKDAEEAVKILSKTIDSGKGVSQDKNYQKLIATAEKQAAGRRTAIEKKRVDLVVDAHRTELEAALKSVTESMDALKDKPEQAAFKAAEKSVSDLRSTIDSGADAGAKDPAYAKRLASLKGKAEDFTKTIDKRRVDAEVSASREKVKAAANLVSERLGALSGKPEAAAFAAAQEAVGDLGVTLAEARPVADKNKVYDKELVAEKKKIDGYQARIAKRKLELEMAEHLASLSAAEAAVKVGVKDGSFDAAEEAVANLEKEIGAGAQFAKADAKHGARLAALKKDLPKRRSLIATARLEADIGQHKKTVAEAVGEADKRLEALGQGPTPSTIKAAEDAVGSLEEALKNGAELAKKNGAHAKWIAGYGKKVNELRGAIGRRAVENQVKAHRAKVDEAQQEVAQALSGLSGKLDYELYAGAEGQIAALGKVLESGGDLAEKDNAYAKELTAKKAKLDGYRVTARRTWIEAADAAVVQRLKALDGKVNEQAFRDAEEAVKVLSKTIDSGKGVSQDKGYLKLLALSEKQAAGRRATIDKKRVSLVVDAHKTELEAAVQNVTGSLDALKEKPEADSFKAAERAVADLRTTIDSGAEAASKDPAYGKRLAALRGKATEYSKTIDKRRSDADAAVSREKVKAAAELVAERLGALSGKPEPAAFSAAQEAVGDLGVAIAEARPMADKNKVFEKELNLEKKKIDGYQARIARRKLDLEMADHLSALSEAEAAVKAGAKDGGFEAAEEAVAALEKEIGAGQRYAKSDPRHGARLAALRKDLPKRRAAIAAARVEAEVVANKKALEAATAEAQQRVESLGAGATPGAVKAAETAIDSLKEAVKAGQELAKKNAKHAKLLVTYSKRAADLRGSIGRRAVETEVRAHRAQVEAAQAEALEHLKALEGKLEYSLYEQAEGSVSELKKAIEAGSSLGEKDDRYGRELAKAAGQIEGHRVMIRRRWIEAAEGAVVERVKALEASADEKSLKAADDAVKTLDATIDSGKGLTKDKKYALLLASSAKRAKTLRASIDRRRSQAEFGEVRAELDRAAAEEATLMKALAAGGDETAVEAASSAIEALSQSIDANGPAAQKDAAHKKRLAALKARVTADKAKVARLGAVAKTQGDRSKVTEAEAAFSKAMASGLKDDAAIDAAESALSDLNSALDDTKALAAADKKFKVYALGLRKKTATAKLTLTARRSEAAVSEHRAQVEAQLSTVREAMSGLGKDRGAYDAAAKSVEELVQLIGTGTDLGKRNKKYGLYLASARKTTKIYQTTIKKKRPAAEPERTEAPAAEADPADDPKAKLASAQATVRDLLKALGKKPSKDKVAAAKTALDVLSDTIEESKAAAKKSKPFAAKVGAARLLLKTGQKRVSRLEGSAR